MSKRTKTNERIKRVKNLISGKSQIKKHNIELLEKPCSIMKNLSDEYVIKKGAQGKIICLNDYCDESYIIKERIYYDIDIDDNNPFSSVNSEVEIFKLLNNFVYSKITPHIPLYMGDFICDIKKEKYRYLLVEKAEGTFEDILKKHDRMSVYVWKVLLFQILYTLASIQEKYPSFIHNDLKIDNILYFKTKNEGKYSYIINGKKYILNDVKVSLSIWDFGLSCIDGTIQNSELENIILQRVDRNILIGIQQQQNRYKDVYKLFNFFLILIGEMKIPNEIMEFFRKYVIQNVKHDGFYNLIPNIEAFTPKEILNDEFFNVFLEEKEENIIEEYSMDNELQIFGSKFDERFMKPEFPDNCYNYRDYPLFLYKDEQQNNERGYEFRFKCTEIQAASKSYIDRESILDIVNFRFRNINIKDERILNHKDDIMNIMNLISDRLNIFSTYGIPLMDFAIDKYFLKKYGDRRYAKVYKKTKLDRLQLVDFITQMERCCVIYNI